MSCYWESLVTLRNRLRKGEISSEELTRHFLERIAELDPKIILNADKIIVDNWEQNKHRGDLAPLVEKGLITKDHIYGEIGEIVAGLKPGRENGDETIVACLIGLGSLDIACANFVYNESHKRKMGGVFDFQQKS